MALPIILFALLLSACGGAKAPVTQKTPSAATKLLINELPLSERPFTVLVPHISNRLFTFYAQNADKAKAASIDLEYQSGDLLKGVRATLESPIKNPYIKGIILGSCSTGGKCTFDTELKSGTMKFKLNFPNQDATHVLKGDFTFLNGQTSMPDGKVSFQFTSKKAATNLIMANSFGLPKSVSKEILLYPIVISSTSDKNVTGSLSVNATGVTSAVIYDGTDYQPLKFETVKGSLVFKLDQKPWSKTANITRDDQKGAVESLSLYLVGPILLYK